MTSQPASRASIASTNALGPGTDTSTVAGSPAIAEPVVRGATVGAPPPPPDVGAAGASDRSTAASAAVRSPSASSRSATTMSWGEAADGTSKPSPLITSRLSGVAIATWAVTMPGSAWTSRLTWSSATESAYAERSST